jgi:dCMP deaminase
MNNIWDERFLRMAREIATWSKDPSTKVGAVIADPKNRIVSLGYNGLPRNVADTVHRLSDRETKNRIVVHAEENAILFAGRSLQFCSIYVWPFAACAHCASLIVQVGINRVVAPAPFEREYVPLDARLSEELYAEADVKYVILENV